MPYKNTRENRIKINAHRLIYDRKRKDNFYLSILDQYKYSSMEDLISFLMSIDGVRRSALLKRIPETERNKIDPILKKELHKRTKSYKKIRFQNNNKFIQKLLNDFPCPCGERNTNKLEFHHTDPSQKTKESIQLLCRNSIKTIKKEIKHCKILCRNCHILHHNGDSKTQLERLINIYLKSKTKKRSGDKSKVLLFLYKLNQKCQKCNFSESSCLVFHHIQSSNKTNKICQMEGVPTLNREISKTICLCQNCHGEFHTLYGNKTNQTQLEEYLGKPVVPNIVDLNIYQEEFKKLIS